jgi:hypothetical protein
MRQLLYHLSETGGLNTFFIGFTRSGYKYGENNQIHVEGLDDSLPSLLKKELWKSEGSCCVCGIVSISNLAKMFVSFFLSCPALTDSAMA